MKKPAKKWRLFGFDTFSGETYRLPGSYASEAQVNAAARKRLEALEKSQPSESSGGQSDIQDRVFIERPDGTRYRFRG